MGNEALEEVAECVLRVIVMPALDKRVADSANPYDDAALAVAKPMLLSLIDKIDGEEG